MVNMTSNLWCLQFASSEVAQGSSMAELELDTDPSSAICTNHVQQEDLSTYERGITWRPMGSSLRFQIHKKWRRGILGGWLTVGALIVSGVFLIIYLTYQAGRRHTLADHCVSWSLLLGNRIAESTGQARVFTSLMTTFYFQHLSASVGAVNESTFSQFATSSNLSRPYLFSISYAERVPAERVPDVLALYGWPCIRDLKTSDCIQYHAEEYIVVLFNANHNKSIAGFDMNSNPFWADAIARARDTGISGAITAPIEGAVNRVKHGIGKAFPVYNSVWDPSSTVAQPACRGYIVSFFDFTMMWESLYQLLGSTQPNAFIRVFDITISSAPILLYEPSTQKSDSLNKGSYLTTTKLDLGDPARSHEMRCRYKTRYAFPTQAVAWTAVALVLVLLSLYITWTTLCHVERVEHDYEAMEQMRDEMNIAKEAAESASRTKGQFLATMSHELRTPMNGVIGMLSLLGNTTLDSTQQDYLDTARSSGKALVSLINDVLDLSKIEADKLMLEEIVFDIRSEIDSLLSMFMEVARDKPKVELAAFVADDVPQSVVGDPTRIRQVLINLLGNAWKFTKSGHIFLCVRVAEDDEDLTVAPASEPTPITLNPEQQPSNGATKLFPRKGRTEKRQQSSTKLGSSTALNPHVAINITAPAEEQLPLRAPPALEDGPAISASELQSVPSAVGLSRATNLDAERFVGGEWLTLSGAEAVDSCNSWHRIKKKVEPPLGCQHCYSIGSRQGGDTKPQSGSRVRLVFSVEDTGMGIPRAAQKKIFQPFVQADASTTRTHGGTGIGLSISRKLISLMGGSLSFNSVPTVGSTFYFDICLPIGSGTLESPSPAIAGLQLKGILPVVVGCRPVHWAVFASHLSRLGLQVHRSDGPCLTALESAANTSGTVYIPSLLTNVVIFTDGSAFDDHCGLVNGLSMNGPETFQGAPSLNGQVSPKAGLKQEVSRGSCEPQWPFSLLPGGILLPVHLVLGVQDPAKEAPLKAAGAGFVLLKLLRRNQILACLKDLQIKAAEQSAANRRSSSAPGGDIDHQVPGGNGLSRTASLKVKGPPVKKAGEEAGKLTKKLIAALTGKKFLVVDDNMVNRKVISKLLERWGVNVDAVSSGQKAVDYLHDGPHVDCVLMDVMMPEMDGFQATRLIRKRELERSGGNVSKRLAIFALTADILVETRQLAVESGMDGFLSKPIEDEQLQRVLGAIFPMG